MDLEPGRPVPRKPRWPWVVVGVVALVVIAYLVLDAFAGTHGV